MNLQSYLGVVSPPATADSLLRPFFQPAVCRVGGAYEPVTSAETLRLLHNEEFRASAYPLDVRDQTYFSEVMGPGNPDAVDYAAWVAETLELISAALAATREECLSLAQVDVVGRQIQQVDARQAAKRIGRPPDALHALHGIDAIHPYRKSTLCRTAVPARINDQPARLLYEKFLVSYSYWDATGRRQCTTTPLHSHPLNHEIVYFIRHTLGARVEEESFVVCDRGGIPAVLPDGSLNPRVMWANGQVGVDQLTVQPIGTEVLTGTDQPVILDPFDGDAPLMREDIYPQVESFFRTHRVTVVDGPVSADDPPDAGTLYYAINNYWGLSGRVLMYHDDAPASAWDQAAWTTGR